MRVTSMNRMKAFCTFLFVVALPMAAQPTPSDVVTVGTVAGSAGSTVTVPVFIRDTSATTVGIDQPFGSRIQSYSIRVAYAPTSAVQSITFTRSGIAAPLTPLFENSPATLGAISLIDTFAETTNLIPFTSNAALPGNEVGQLNVTLAPDVAPGTTITLMLDPTLTQVSDEGGTPATLETQSNGRLTLVSGAITVVNPVPSVSTWGLLLLAASLAVFAVRMRIS